MKKTGTGKDNTYDSISISFTKGVAEQNISDQRNEQQAYNYFMRKRIDLYKTEMCRGYEEDGTCKYGDKCQFAHDITELRNVKRHPRYKTEICKTYWEDGSCPYGRRCCFIHKENRIQRVLISGNINSSHSFIDCDDIPLTHINTSSSKYNEEKFEKKYNNKSTNEYNSKCNKECNSEYNKEYINEYHIKSKFNLKTPFGSTNEATIWMEGMFPLLYIRKTNKRELKASKQPRAPGEGILYHIKNDL
ncbi:mRNA decay activator protein ZFP36L1 [Astathelohania contejeani]|uniref:mRNA decay activator protein ZFP36L1 n=1 Tax=Astathelohania contejeani TaxID=164912 RepID=A0ABQ7I0Y6_9MICR|nr:mRNA decay activator protein ZFP36L1 [Thelohania contejeani]